MVVAHEERITTSVNDTGLGRARGKSKTKFEVGSECIDWSTHIFTGTIIIHYCTLHQGYSIFVGTRVYDVVEKILTKWLDRLTPCCVRYEHGIAKSPTVSMRLIVGPGAMPGLILLVHKVCRDNAQQATVWIETEKLEGGEWALLVQDQTGRQKRDEAFAQIVVDGLYQLMGGAGTGNQPGPCPLVPFVTNAHGFNIEFLYMLQGVLPVLIIG